MRDPGGFLSIILHAHLPYVKHPEHEDSLEERWLFQALTECYIPLLKVFSGLARDGVPYRVAVSISPPLLEMLADPILQDRYKRYLEVLIDLAEREAHRTLGDDRLHALAAMYRDRFREAHALYTDTYRKDLVSAWRGLSRAGGVELMTSAATHGYLPLLLDRKAVEVQVLAGLAAFRRRFGESPRGFWLPECAYSPEVEQHLRGRVSYFILETHGILLAAPRPRFGFHAPIVTPAKLMAFGRDPECSKQVWSADEGYPGDGVYREFYRDAGYDLPVDYLGKALPGGTRAPTGLKYHRVTDRKSQFKDLYDPKAAEAKAREHAANFLFWRTKESEYYGSVLGRIPIMVAPYDAELFGHWWYEGPTFLDELFRLMARPEVTVKPITPSDYASYYPVNQVAQPAISSWGYNGYNEVWLEASNDWIYRHLHASQERMAAAVRRHQDASGLAYRALNQAGREILLAQASDWPFIMKSGSLPGYARKRFVSHLGRLQKLLDQVDRGAVDPVFLRNLEEKDSIFQDMDLVALWRDSEAVPAS